MNKLLENYKRFFKESLVNENMYFKNTNSDQIENIESMIDEKMDELIGKGDYSVGYSEEQNRFIVSFRSGDVESSCVMAEEVVDFVNIERTVLRVGNCSETMFWLTWINE